MNRRRILFLLMALAVAVAATLGVRALSDGRAREVRKVEKRVRALAEAVSFAEGDSPFQRLGYPDRVAGFFAPVTEVDIAVGQREARVVLPKAELKERSGVLRAASRGLSVQFLDVVVNLNEGMDEATAHLTSKIYFTGDPDYTVQEFRLLWSKDREHGWQLQRISTVQTME